MVETTIRMFKFCLFFVQMFVSLLVSIHVIFDLSNKPWMCLLKSLPSIILFYLLFIIFHILKIQTVCLYLLHILLWLFPSLVSSDCEFLVPGKISFHFSVQKIMYKVISLEISESEQQKLMQILVVDILNIWKIYGLKYSHLCFNFFQNLWITFLEVMTCSGNSGWPKTKKSMNKPKNKHLFQKLKGIWRRILNLKRTYYSLWG